MNAAATALENFRASIDECMREAVMYADRGDAEGVQRVLMEAARLVGLAMAGAKARSVLGAVFGRG